MFKRYLELGSVNQLAAELRARGVTTKQRISKRGRQSGGVHYTPGALYHLLRNPIYRGEIRHKGTQYAGQHEAIIDSSLWEKVQQRLQEGTARPRSVAVAGSAACLSGKLIDTAGHRMTPVHTRKADGRRYRAYVSQAVIRKASIEGVQIPRISAGVIEPLVLEALRRQPRPVDLETVQRIVVGHDCVRIEIRGAGNESQLIDVRVQLCQRGRERQIRTVGGVGGPTHLQPDPTLVRAMIRAYHWRAQLETGEMKSIEALSRAENVNATYVARLLPLAYLAPDLTEAILDGRQSPDCTLTRLRAAQIPLAWDAQRALFGGSTPK